MNLWMISGLVTAVTAASWALTRTFRNYALRRGVLDRPNDRSLHVRPTPRGGGAAIVVTTLLVLYPLALTGLVDWNIALGLWGAGVIVAVTGFLDDHRHVPRRWRLIAHFSAAAVVLASVGGTRQLAIFDPPVNDWLIWPLALLYIAWIINLTNFMDGIDGLAASEAVTVSCGGVLLYVLAGAPADTVILPVVFAAAASGFLIWNRPPAAIFMGDVGSGFVGLLLAAMSIQALTVSASLFWGWLILLGTFVVDASITLIRRALRAERVYEAHRTHAYQQAAVRWGTHGRITLAVVGINLFWLLPLACLVAVKRIDAIAGLIVAYVPLAAVATRLGAGLPATLQPRDDSHPARR